MNSKCNIPFSLPNCIWVSTLTHKRGGKQNVGLSCLYLHVSQHVCCYTKSATINYIQNSEIKSNWSPEKWRKSIPITKSKPEISSWQTCCVLDYCWQRYSGTLFDSMHYSVLKFNSIKESGYRVWYEIEYQIENGENFCCWNKKRITSQHINRLKTHIPPEAKVDGWLQSKRKINQELSA